MATWTALPRVVQGQDVGMTQVGGHLELAQEALGSERTGQLMMQDLERHGAMVALIAREVQRRLPPR